jgi:hypothetical protein
MNVRLQPTVRCAFVPEENALKLILKETVDAPSADVSTEPDLKQELVIYVLKVRCHIHVMLFLLTSNFNSPEGRVRRRTSKNLQKRLPRARILDQ